MLKGIKINKTPKHRSIQDLVTELVATHQHIFDLVSEGYPDMQPSILKAQQLEKQYFQQLMCQPKDSYSLKPQLPHKEGDVPIRSDMINYEEEVRNAKKPPKYLQSNKMIDNCMLCPQNQGLCIVSSSNHVYLAIVKTKQFFKYHHFYLCPVQHVPSTLMLQSHVVDQINNFKKCLIQMFDTLDCHIVFYETYCSKSAHLCIQCLAVPSAKAGDFPFYFKQGLDACEGDWSTNKSIIEIKKEKGGLLKQIPRNFRYFYIDFSLGYGYAHIIQDQKSWKQGFAVQIIASLLGMESHEVLTTRQLSEEEISKKVTSFNDAWKEFDWTVIL